MICRRIYRKNPWSFSQWWRSVYSAAAPPSSAAATARSAGFEKVSISRAQADIFMKPRKLFYFRNPYKGNGSSISFGDKGCNFTTQAISVLPIDGVVDVPLAQTGEGIAECELLKWFVHEGDQVEEFQPLCEVQSDKATIEITSRYKGKVLKFLHVPGNIVKVGETLLKMIVDDNAFSNQRLEALEITKAPLVSNASELDVVDIGLKKANIGGVASTPAVRNFAKQLGVNIEDVHGTGKDGRVLKEDVLSYSANEGITKESSGSFAASSDEREYEDRTITLRGFQRAMIKSMTLAAKIPHFHYVDEIKCNALVELKASFQNENSDPGSHNIGIAMATPHGLVVPNIKKVQSLSILEITKELSRLQQLALANKLSSDDISGETITVSNIGTIGGKFGSPLINVPEVSIIAIGRIQKVPQFDDDENVYPASIMTVNIGADHRVLDGATVGYVLQ
ncbi:lipoamide acyltransferase component of branched-chain alpha-keto acid dehydrogenase complex mitochondrial [Phtheirospermum japonicum]|uniref:Dihydrolipoamide acetyltransferase component of pyruvate dehydrogenase complex n=1 Tax=Phtheirospermum japonicum TaxID=374723 RepID=A0A830CW25_9LAMI|nr:lipoamide acyltransferase component of branched-chain alpha-keto acid dehydrogenase complex mitochondrial [Phtheirospermum japonicum]